MSIRNDLLEQILAATDTGTGIGEAPQDASPYARQDAGWVPTVEYPPAETGTNVEQIELLVVSGNTQDSVATDDIDTYVVALTNSPMFYPNPVYETGVWVPSVSEIKTQLSHAAPRASEILVSGTITSDSATNDGFLSIRLVDSSGPLTGASKRYSTGRTAGAATVNVGFSIIGYSTLTNGQDLHLEVSKDFSGSIVVDGVLFTVKPLW